MKIGLVSDTHMPRHGKALPRALVEGFREASVGMILHTGDFTSLAIVPWFELIAPFDAVAGNNDGPDIVARFGRRKIVTVDGARIGLIHGDGMKKSTLERAWDAFVGENVQAVCFGHSHIPYLEHRDGVLIVNPGSASDKRYQPRYSYALLTVNAGQVTAEIRTYEDKSP